MQPETVDLRSDTVTKPTAEMRAVMAGADVGDDVLGADPTAARLEAAIAATLGKEAALFMPSGTMTNQVAVRLHCRPGDELLCEQDCHIYQYEQGAFAQLSGVVAHTVPGVQGVLNVEDLVDLIRPADDHMVRTRLVCVENTHNRGGGKIQPFEGVRAISAWAREHGIAMHLDGARLFNAVVASGRPAAEWAALFDTVSVCFSKGLGAPVGSALAGSRELIRTARRYRKLFGGGMRQCGILAAGALHAVQHHVDRLAEDHLNARLLAAELADVVGISLPFGLPETNILFFDIDPSLGTAYELANDLQSQGVFLLAETRQRIRALTHLDVDEDGIRRAVAVIREVAERRMASTGEGR